jgi:lysocardiolipin and lysophospholipid acyltransferase
MLTTMTTDGVRQRIPPASVAEKKEREKNIAEQEHPAGPIKHGALKQAIRMSLFAMYFNSCIIA